MFWEQTGRKEKRLPIMVAVSLTPVSPAGIEKRERTYTDNISEHGARVRATCPWQLGQEAEIAPVKGEEPMRGEVVYCQKVAHESFFIGLRFHSHVPWSVMHRFNGMFMMTVFCAACHF